MFYFHLVWKILHFALAVFYDVRSKEQIEAKLCVGGEGRQCKPRKHTVSSDPAVTVR